MQYSSIQITKDFKEILKKMKIKGKSYEAIIRDLIASHEQAKLDKIQLQEAQASASQPNPEPAWNQATIPKTGRIRLTKAAGMEIEWRIKQ